MRWFPSREKPRIMHAVEEKKACGGNWELEIIGIGANILLRAVAEKKNKIILVLPKLD